MKFLLRESYETVRIALAVDVESDDHALIVDAINYGRADSLRPIDRLEFPIEVDKPMAEILRIQVEANHHKVIVDSLMPE